MASELIKEHLKLLPEKPGCYLMKDINDKIIYVGKAKILKNRVKSYFTGAHNAKTTKLVSLIHDFEYIITNSEKEALVLECNLIKKHTPKYNIMLMDDKSYPYILLTNEINPRLIVYRTLSKKRRQGHLFGPYPNVSSARNTAIILNRILPFRKCLTIPKHECLYYHMHQCLAPCINHDPIDYSEYKKKATSFLNGNTKEILNELNEKMLKASSDLKFEDAKEYRDLINDINITTSKQKISINDLNSRDIIGVYSDSDDISICVLYMRNGSIVQNYYTNFSIIGDKDDLVKTFILQFYNDPDIIPSEILIDEEYSSILDSILDTNVTTPLKGSKKELLDMANHNAFESINNKRLLYQNRVLKKIDTIEHLGELLHINPPYYIEAFDNSNIMGEYPVSAMVVYKDGKKVPSLYRKYHVKSVKGANDYETMKEVVYRRYYRLMMEGEAMPDLIIMDGGEIQVNACKEIIDSLNLNINICGIKKDDNHKAACLVYNNQEFFVSKNSDIYLLLANISQTVHDFAISFFRSTKAKGMFKSRLDGIKGIGPKKKELLLKHFITIDKIKNASDQEYQEIGINSELASLIREHLNKEGE